MSSAACVRRPRGVVMGTTLPSDGDSDTFSLKEKQQEKRRLISKNESSFKLSHFHL